MGRKPIRKSLEDEDFRRRLLDDPKAAIEQELGVGFPAEVQVRAVQETAETIYLVLPRISPLGGEVGELSDRDLEQVAGGGDTVPDCTVFDSTCGPPNVQTRAPTCAPRRRCIAGRGEYSQGYAATRQASD